MSAGISIHSYKRVAIVIKSLVIVLSLLVLATWEFDVLIIKNLLPGRQLSNPITALSFICGSISLFLLSRKNGQLNLLGRLIAVLVVYVGLVIFISILFHSETIIDKWLYADKLMKYGNYGLPNYMAPNTAFNFFILGLSLVFFSWRKYYLNYLIAEVLALVILLLSSVSMVGYFYHSLEFYGMKSYIPMAFPTAISFFFLSVAILFCDADRGIFNVFTRPYYGSRVARFLTPFIIAIPVIFGKIELYGIDTGWYSPNFGSAIFAIANIVIFIILICYCSKFLNRSNIVLQSEIRERKKLNETISGFNRALEKKVEERTKQIDKNEKLFRSMIENSVDVISIVDKANRLTYVSPSIEGILGLNPEALIGTTGMDLIHPDSTEEIIQLNKSVREQPGVIVSATLRLKHSRGNDLWAEGTMVNLLNDPNVRGIVTNFHDITRRKQSELEKARLEQKLIQERISHQRRLMQASLDGQEKEKKQIGMELHDNINQILTASKLYLEVGMTDEVGRQEMLQKSKEQILNAIDEIRNLSRTLVPHGVGVGNIMEGIGNIIQMIQTSTNLKITTEVPSELAMELTSNQEVAVYRVIQEQLNNIVKHAQASNVEIRLRKEANTMLLMIRDDGKGFDPNKKRAGIGLSNINSRAELLNGDINIESAINKGCCLTLSFPVGE